MGPGLLHVQHITPVLGMQSNFHVLIPLPKRHLSQMSVLLIFGRTLKSCTLSCNGRWAPSLMRSSCTSVVAPARPDAAALLSAHSSARGSLSVTSARSAPAPCRMRYRTFIRRTCPPNLLQGVSIHKRRVKFSNSVQDCAYASCWRALAKAMLHISIVKCKAIHGGKDLSGSMRAGRRGQPASRAAMEAMPRPAPTSHTLLPCARCGLSSR